MQTKKTIKIEIMPNGVLQILQVTSVTINRQTMSQNHRTALTPGTDLTNWITERGFDPECEGIERVQEVANTIWTPEIIQEYQEQFNEEESS